jgi:cytochrome c oxidase subunit 2
MARTVAAIGAGLVLAADAALADTTIGPVDGAMDLQPGVTEVARGIHQFHTLLFWIITGVTAFVLVLLLYVMARFNKRANPTPKKFTHNLFVEVVWTVVPVIILVVIAAFSFPLLFKQEQIPQAELTIKATGNTWNWSYAYPDQNVEFLSNPISEEEAKEQNRPFRMAVDEPLVVPVNTTVRVLVTANDVIHAFSVPSLGIKEDGIPGRVNETWFKADTTGTFYGFCQELCGIGHSYMPIEVRVVTQPQFEAFIASKGGQLATAAPAPAAPPAAAPETAPAATPEAPAPAGQPG